MEVINRKKRSDSSFIAGLNGKQVGIYAHTLLAAKQLAVEHFRPKKKEVGLLWVEPAEI